MKKLFLTLSLVISVVFFAVAQNAADMIVGNWRTIDDETGKAKSIVRIYKTAAGKYYGVIDKLLNRDKGDEDPDCKHCDTYSGKYKAKNNKVIGIIIIRDLVFDKDDNEWEDGTIFDPNNGKEYYCSLEINEGKLKVRGSLDSWGIAGRTQTWYPEK